MMLKSFTPRASAAFRPALRVPAFRLPTVATRFYSLAEEPVMDEYEKKIYSMLQDSFLPKALQVKDVSGGCGSMFAILVESEKFKGIPMIKQHRLVNEVLKDEISKWHGIQLRTKSA